MQFRLAKTRLQQWEATPQNKEIFWLLQKSCNPDAIMQFKSMKLGKNGLLPKEENALSLPEVDLNSIFQNSCNFFSNCKFISRKLSLIIKRAKKVGML